MELSTWLALYAALLSTILAILNIVKFIQERDKQKIKLSAELLKEDDFDTLVSCMYVEPIKPYPPQNSATLFQVKIVNGSDFSIKLDCVKVISDLGEFSAYKQYAINGNPNYHSPISEEFKVEVPAKEYRKFDVVIPKGYEALKANKIRISTVCGKVISIKI